MASCPKCGGKVKKKKDDNDRKKCKRCGILPRNTNDTMKVTKND